MAPSDQASLRFCAAENAILERRATTKNNENQSVCDRLERRATTKNKTPRACVIDFLSCISYTGTSYPDWVSS